MVSIETEQLKNQADILNREARRYDYRISALEETLYWMNQKEFKEKEQIRRTLIKQCEELREQKRKLLVLAEGMLRICEKYNSTERRITDSEDVYWKVIKCPRIDNIYLYKTRRFLYDAGLNLTDQ